jgi:type II secretory pathway pseudopilin PulG
MSRRRGFTMIELLVYLALATAGLLVLGSIEIGAQRALELQEALIDVELAADELLGALRLDVESSRRLELDRSALVVHRADGKVIRYEAGSRTETPQGGKPQRRAFAANVKLEVTLDAGPGQVPVVTVTGTFVRGGRFGEVRRVLRRSAAPRREVGDA